MTSACFPSAISLWLKAVKLSSKMKSVCKNTESVAITKHDIMWVKRWQRWCKFPLSTWGKQFMVKMPTYAVSILTPHTYCKYIIFYFCPFLCIHGSTLDGKSWQPIRDSLRSASVRANVTRVVFWFLFIYVFSLIALLVVIGDVTDELNYVCLTEILYVRIMERQTGPDVYSNVSVLQHYKAFFFLVVSQLRSYFFLALYPLKLFFHLSVRESVCEWLCVASRNTFQ